MKSNLLSNEEYENSANDYEFHYGNFLPTDKDTPILDIGCGAGHFLYYLKKKGYTNFFGIDVSEDQVELCKKNITSKVELADIFQYLRDIINDYGAISANDVIEHIPKENVLTFLELIHRALKPDGILLLKLPNMSNPFALDSRYRDFTHECGFTEKSIFQVLYVTGFRDIRIYPAIHTGKSSIKSYIAKMVMNLAHMILKKLFWYQGFTAPEILSSRLFVIAGK
jgi:cyclopropane fatty-acyl-phospholipid synthase-like methyltransferase